MLAQEGFGEAEATISSTCMPEIVASASRYLFNWVWLYDNKDSSLCSTLWSEAYRKAGIDLCPDVKFPVPEDLAKSRYLHKVGIYNAIKH